MLIRARFPTALQRGVRHMSIADRCAWRTLGLQPGTPPAKIKQRFYALAKATHPDVATVEEGASFVEVLAAFESLMAGGGTHIARHTTAPNHAARAGRATGSKPRRGDARGSATAEERERSLGEVLCDRLVDEPEAVREVWDQIVTRQLDLRDSMLEAIFRACGKRSSMSGGGLRAAIHILREANAGGMLQAPGRKEAAVISIIKWCKEDAGSFDTILNELDDTERTPEVSDTLTAANRLYSGLSDAYGAST